MNPGDMVGLAFTVTRKGYSHEDQVGLIIEIIIEDDIEKAVVNFAGVLLTYPIAYLRLISERW
jgi:hypothetical protein